MGNEQFLKIENILFTITMVMYLGSMVLYFLFVVVKKERFAKIIDVKSFVTLTMTLGMVLMLTGVFNPPTEVFALFSTAYGSVITYFFTKKDTKSESEDTK